MKKTILSILMTVGLSVAAFGQGTVIIDNHNNTGVYNGNGGVPFTGANSGTVYSSQVTSNGLIFTANSAAQAQNLGGPAGSQLLGVDVSFTLLGGASAGSLSVITNVTGSQINTPVDDNSNWGNLVYSTPALNVPGSTANSPVFLELLVWEGNSFSTYASAVGKVYSGDTGVFVNPSGGGLTPAAGLTGMPDLLLTIPEPSTFALAGLGAAALMAFRRRK